MSEGSAKRLYEVFEDFDYYEAMGTHVSLELEWTHVSLELESDFEDITTVEFTLGEDVGLDDFRFRESDDKLVIELDDAAVHVYNFETMGEYSVRYGGVLGTARPDSVIINREVTPDV